MSPSLYIQVRRPTGSGRVEHLPFFKYYLFPFFFSSFLPIPQGEVYLPPYPPWTPPQGFSKCAEFCGRNVVVFCFSLAVLRGGGGGAKTHELIINENNKSVEKVPVAPSLVPFSFLLGALLLPSLYKHRCSSPRRINVYCPIKGYLAQIGVLVLQIQSN